MGLQLWKPLMLLSIFLLSFRKIRVHGDPQVPCYFIFGDSLSDNGNNNIRLTLVRADYHPYGIDFTNSVPTGRFTNDRNTVDFIAKMLGFPNFIPPFAQATGPEILQGVNYASGGGGIREDTGAVLGLVIPLKEQILNHRTTISRIRALLRSRNSTEELLNKCIYNVNIGSNDYLLNYFLPPLSLTRTLFTPEQYALDLIRRLRSQLEDIYRLGARKFAVFGLGLIGCTPYARARFSSDGSSCADQIDEATNRFNVKLKSLAIQLSTKLPGAKFTYINSRVLIPSGGQLINNTACCPISVDGLLCQPLSTPCLNRERYVFYDAVHPSNVTFYYAAHQAYLSTSPDVVYPFSISQLATL